MANSTLNQNDNDHKEDQLNPGQAHYDRKFNDLTANAKQTVDPSAENANLERSKMRAREKSAGLNGMASESSRQREPQGGWATNIAGTAVTAAVKVPFVTKKRGGIIGGIIGILAAIGLFMGIFMPNYAIVNLKEVAVDKFIQDQLAVMEERSGIIMRKKMTPNGTPETTDSCAIKVRCRFKGMSQRGINKLEKAGFKIESKDITGHPLKHKRITSIIYNIDGSDVQITAQEFNKVMRTNPKLRNSVYQAYKPRTAILTDSVARWLSNKLRIFRGNQMEGVKDDETRRSVVRKALSGGQIDADGNRLRNGNEPTNSTDENRQKLGDIADDYTEEADKARAEFDSDKPMGSLPNVDSPAVVSASDTLKAGGQAALKGLLFGPIAAADSICAVYYMIAAVGFGAKVIANEQLIRFFHLFTNTADAIKAGDATPEQVGQLGKMLSKKDENGRTFADSFGYQYMAYNHIGNTDETMKYKLGGGLTGSLTNLKSEIDRVGGGDGCDFVTNPIVQGGAFLLYVVGSFFTGGGLSAASVAGSIAISAAVAVATMIIQPMLIRLVAGIIVTGDEHGRDVGNAFTAGGGAHASMLGKSRALIPMTKPMALTFDRQSAETIALAKAAERESLSPFDITNPLTPAGSTFARVAPYMVDPFSETAVRGVANILNPINTFNSVFSVFIPKAHAAQAVSEYDICTDPDYAQVAGGLATDPFCNVKYGFDLDIIRSAEYDPETGVIEYMLNAGYIDNDGNPVPDSQYETFIVDCLENNNPIAHDGDEQYSLPPYCYEEVYSEDAAAKKRNIMMRLYFIDTSIYDGMRQQQDGEKIATPASLSGKMPLTANTDTGASTQTGGSAPAGTPQELAQKIIDSGKVTGFTAEMNQIRAYARGDFSCNVDTRILQIILYGAQRGHTFFITSLNRACTGSNAGHSRDHHSRDGGGHAVDIDNVNGGGSTGGLAKDVAFLRDILPAMPPNTEIGQRNCRTGANVLNAPGMEQVNDTCTHLHIGVPG